MRREHPSEGDSHHSGVEVDQSLPFGAGDRPGDQGVGDGEEDFGHPEGIKGVDLPTHEFRDQRPGNVGEQHDQGHHGDFVDFHFHVAGEEGNGNGEYGSSSGFGTEEQGDHQPFEGFVLTKDRLGGHVNLFESRGEDVGVRWDFSQLGAFAEEKGPRVAQEDDPDGESERSGEFGGVEVVHVEALGEGHDNGGVDSLDEVLADHEHGGVVAHFGEVVGEVGEVGHGGDLVHDEEVAPDDLEDVHGEPGVQGNHDLETHRQGHDEGGGGAHDLTVVCVVHQGPHDRHGHTGDDPRDDVAHSEDGSGADPVHGTGQGIGAIGIGFCIGYGETNEGRADESACLVDGAAGRHVHGVAGGLFEVLVGLDVFGAEEEFDSSEERGRSEAAGGAGGRLFRDGRFALEGRFVAVIGGRGSFDGRVGTGFVGGFWLRGRHG